MLLPLSEVIPGWPWQARQLSSCLSGGGAFGSGAARAEVPRDKCPQESNTKKMKPNRLTAYAVLPYLQSFSASQTPTYIGFILFNLEGFPRKFVTRVTCL